MSFEEIYTKTVNGAIIGIIAGITVLLMQSRKYKLWKRILIATLTAFGLSFIFALFIYLLGD